MTIGTGVFERISKENQQAAISAIADIMEQTTRFGSFNRAYVEKCAEEFFAATLTKLRKRTKTAMAKR